MIMYRAGMLNIRNWRRLCALAGSVLLLCGAGPAEITAWQDKVDPRVLSTSRDRAIPFIAVLSEQAELRAAANVATKAARGTFVVERLQAVATRTQKPLIAWLTKRNIEYRTFWVTNMVQISGDREVVEAVARRPEVDRLDADPWVINRLPVASTHSRGNGGGRSIEWNIAQVGADQLWALGYRGAGVVIGGQDTGYDWDHPVLIGSYRGWDGANAEHAYNWHDAVHISLGSCGSDSQEPCDDHNHGTHTMGTMVGDDGASNRTGMAPDATWIGCRNMNAGRGSPTSYAECFEWFMAPTDLNGENPDPTRAPHVINNSWNCPDSEGCNHDSLRQVVENVKTAGIVVVVSAGNNGPGCSTVMSPPAIYDAAFSVGATDSADHIAEFSSRGPVTVDGSDRLKPEVSAPGVNVRSSIRGGGYSSFNGTSMAGPHVVGAVALLLSARPDLAGDVDTIERLIELSALPFTDNQPCGGIPGTEIPNPIYGYGRIDTVGMVLGDADSDGTNNLTDCRPLDPGLWTSPGAVTDLRLDGRTPTTLTWSVPAQPGSNAPTYDVFRSAGTPDFFEAACLETNVAGQTTEDQLQPDEILYYLVNVKNDCGQNLGSGDPSQPNRSVPECQSSSE
jgi:serine protease AprX